MKSPYYLRKMASSTAFEIYATQWLSNLFNMRVEHLSSVSDQFDHGDAAIIFPSGKRVYVEFKFDHKRHKTGNLFVEIEEKPDVEKDEMVASGIFARSDFKWYAIGDHSVLYIVDREVLQAEWTREPRRYRMIDAHDDEGRLSGHGFLVPEPKMKSLAKHHLSRPEISWDGKRRPVKETKVTQADLEEIGRVCFGIDYAH